MARYNNKNQGDKIDAVVIVTGAIYNIIQKIGASCSGIKAAARLQEKSSVNVYLDELHKAVRQLDAEIDAMERTWA